MSATLHENFVKCLFVIFGEIHDADFNGGSLTVLRLQFREIFNIATSCNSFATSATISKFCIISRSPELISDDGDALFLIVLVLSAFENSAALEFSSNRCNALHPDSYRRIYIVRLASACQRIVFTS